MASPEPRTVTYTHKGWFGLCPIYLADVKGDCPDIDVRHSSLAWLLSVTEYLFGAIFLLATAMNPHYEPAWPILVTGRLAKPKVRRHG